MKIVKKDYKKQTVIKPETADDLWNISNILSSGDSVTARTVRTLQTDDKKRKACTLTLTIEKIEFDEEGKALKLLGKITHGPDDVSWGHHTLRIEENDVITVEKTWKQHQIRRLEKASKVKPFTVLVCVMDERKADFAYVTNKGVKMIGSVKGGSGKQFSGPDSTGKFYSDIIAFMKEHVSKVDKILVAGPGFAKDNMLDSLKDEELSKKCMRESASVTGTTGVNEIIKRGALDRVSKDSQISEDTQIVENFLEELAKDGLVTYGPKEVGEAIDAGAVETLIVTDKMAREENVEELMSKVEKLRGKVKVVSTDNEAGEKLKNFGGIVAFLRYKL